MVRSLAFAVFALLAPIQVAFAGDPLSGLSDPKDDLWNRLENLPPRRSGDLALSVGFADITYWREYTTPWLAFGIKGGYGTHFGANRESRVGFSVGGSLEGPFPEFVTIAFEPMATVDHVHKHLLLGASVGPAVLAHSRLLITGQEWSFGASPQVSLRIGYSQPWSRVARRLFIVAEPKFRYIAGAVNWSAAITIGSGSGK